MRLDIPPVDEYQAGTYVLHLSETEYKNQSIRLHIVETKALQGTRVDESMWRRHHSC